MGSNQTNSSQNSKKYFGVIGAGIFGSSLAHAISQEDYLPYFWVRDDEQAKSINQESLNPRYMGDQKLIPGSRASRELIDIFENCTEIIFACKSEFLLELIDMMARNELPLRDLIITCKGFDHSSPGLYSQAFAEKLGEEALQNHYFLLSGPSFAKEILENHPTCVTLAGKNELRLSKLQTLFSRPLFRVYRSLDLIGVELGGATKNIIAIATGVAEGLGLGQNSKAALINLGLGEITRIGTAFGAQPQTFLGLAGMGDLVLTCSSLLSRNNQFGYFLGKGHSIEEAQKKVGSTIEGISAAKNLMKMIQNRDIHTPICKKIYEVLFENKKTDVAIQELMSRPLRAEWIS